MAGISRRSRRVGFPERVHQIIDEDLSGQARHALTRPGGRVPLVGAIGAIGIASLLAAGYWSHGRQQAESVGGLSGITGIEDAVAVFPEDHSRPPEGWERVYLPAGTIDADIYWARIRTMPGETLMLAYANLLHEARSVDGWANLGPATDLLNAMAFELNRRGMGERTAEFYNGAMEPNLEGREFLSSDMPLPVDLHLN